MLTTHWGELGLSPDETELWVTDPGVPDITPDPGTIYIIEPNSGAYLGGISLVGYFPSPPHFPWEPLTGDWVLFSPTGETAYVGSGLRLNAPTGSVLVVDRDSRTITKLLMPNLDSAPYGAVICPKI
jgi:DNA-binding beta-propeller fold protein YncE